MEVTQYTGKQQQQKKSTTPATNQPTNQPTPGPDSAQLHWHQI